MGIYLPSFVVSSNFITPAILIQLGLVPGQVGDGRSLGGRRVSSLREFTNTTGELTSIWAPVYTAVWPMTYTSDISDHVISINLPPLPTFTLVDPLSDQPDRTGSE